MISEYSSSDAPLSVAVPGTLLKATMLCVRKDRDEQLWSLLLKLMEAQVGWFHPRCIPVVTLVSEQRWWSLDLRMGHSCREPPGHGTLVLILRTWVAQAAWSCTNAFIYKVSCYAVYP